MREPAKTPIRDDRTRAAADPRKTAQVALHWVAISMVASWVLSPSSARKTRPKVVKNTFHILYFSPFFSSSRNGRMTVLSGYRYPSPALTIR